MSAALVLLVFLVFAALMMRRLVPALIAVPAMALVMSLAAGVPLGELGGIVVGGSASLATVYVAVIFGALLGRVTLDTGIARAIVNVAAEYGGERPWAMALGMCAIVALLFTSLSGLGAVIMVGSIVLPIMMTTGVPRTVGATLFLMSFALGFIFNIVNWKFYTQFFGIAPEAMYAYAIALAGIDALALLTYAGYAFRRERGYAAHAVAAERTAPGVPWYALVTPFLPLVLYYGAHVDATPAFLISAVYGALATTPARAVQTLVAAAIRGVEDVAPAVLLFIGIGMLLAATKLPQFQHALAPVAGPWLRNPIAFVVAFGVLSPLALYRGPLNPFGVGIALFTALLTAHVLPPPVLVAAVMAVVQVQNVCDPTNTANVWVANFTGVAIDTLTRRTLPFQVAVAIVATLAIVVAGGPLHLPPVWAAIVPAASAAELSGMYASPSAANRVLVDWDGTANGSGAAAAVAQRLRGGHFAVSTGHDDPNAGPCTVKPYAAYVRADVTTFQLHEGTDEDVGLRLEDCGGWIAGEWHEHDVFAELSPATVESLASRAADRLLAWISRNPQRAHNLFTRGLATAAGDAPAYYFTLFKTVDGNMRAYVRAGGPAYDAGLRTADVIDKIDGRFWWEYGTFQTQARAYDGKPHDFEVQRGARRIDVRLGSAFAASGER